MVVEAIQIIDSFNQNADYHPRPDADEPIKYGIRDLEGRLVCFIQNDEDLTHDKLLVLSEGVDDDFLDAWFRVDLRCTTLIFSYTTFVSAWGWSRAVEGVMAMRVNMEIINLDIAVVFDNPETMTTEIKKQAMDIQGVSDIPIHYIKGSFWFRDEADAVSFRIGYDEVMLRPENV